MSKNINTADQEKLGEKLYGVWLCFDLKLGILGKEKK